jgi:hypothetical protein
MATCDDKKIIAALLSNHGCYPGDPQATAIFSYRTIEGKQTFAVYWPSRHLSAQLFDMWISPFVRLPICLWTQEHGLTQAGSKWLAEFRKKKRNSHDD